jgi:hypothetical protein
MTGVAAGAVDVTDGILQELIVNAIKNRAINFGFIFSSQASKLLRIDA